MKLTQKVDLDDFDLDLGSEVPIESPNLVQRCVRRMKALRYCRERFEIAFVFILACLDDLSPE